MVSVAQVKSKQCQPTTRGAVYATVNRPRALATKKAARHIVTDSRFCLDSKGVGKMEGSSGLEGSSGINRKSFFACKENGCLTGPADEDGQLKAPPFYSASYEAYLHSTAHTKSPHHI